MCPPTTFPPSFFMADVIRCESCLFFPFVSLSKVTCAAAAVLLERKRIVVAAAAVVATRQRTHRTRAALKNSNSTNKNRMHVLFLPHGPMYKKARNDPQRFTHHHAELQ